MLESEVTISTRVRLARNLQDIPFPFKLDGQRRREVVNSITDTIIEKNLLNMQFDPIDMGGVEPIYKQGLLERHLISPEFLIETRPSSVLKTKDDKISIMVNEEDHLRIQCFSHGLDLQNAMNLCMDVESMLEKRHRFAFDSRYGFLTTCPTNIGTGLRASVMLHLPALVMTGYIKDIIQGVLNLGLTARGIYGENTDAAGNMFQISNQKTLGQTEESIVNNVSNVAMQIISQEKNVRAQMYSQNKFKFEDKVMRALGVLSKARLMSLDESFKLLSDVRLGVDMEIIDEVSRQRLDELLIYIQPGSLQQRLGNRLEVKEMDVYRADLIRELILQKGGLL